MFMPVFKTAIFFVIIWCCYFYPSHGCLEEERTQLLQIKDFINYPHGSNLEKDWVGKNCCSWSGIECNSSSSRVISIQLYSIRDEGLGLWYPNASLFVAFKELEELDLGRNHIGGWVAPQAFFEMQSLRELYLGNNNLFASTDSLQGLCELKNLRVLYLDGNNLVGRTLPPCLSNLSMLEDLSLRDNDLGSYSSALTGLCKLKNLQGLYLDYNNLNGRALPPCLSNLSRLEELSLSGNDLGSYSSALTGLCKLRNLRALYLDSNNLDGRALPPCLSNLSKLETLSLGGNDLGSYSSALTGLCGLNALKFLDLSGNHFNDSSLPMCMGNFSLLEILILYENNLSGHFGNSKSGLKRLQELDLNLNQLTDDGISPWISNLTSLTLLNLGNNKLKGSDTIRGLKRLQYLDLGSNHLTGEGIPPSMSNLTSLTTLFLENNTLKGSDTIRGLCGLSALKGLYLSDNYLSSLPICMGNFSLLENLELSQNNLTSLFGNSIPGPKKLQFLDLDSNQLTDDGISPSISNLTSLISLKLGNNKLKGSEDTMRGLCSLRNLQALDIKRNSIGSNIDPCFGNMHNLSYLDLRRNQFKGNIPSSIFSNLTMLEDIIISQNQFDGLFSFSTFANLSELSYIDLSENIQLEVETESTMWVPTFQLKSLLLNNCILNKRTGYGIPTFISTQQSLNTLELSHTSLKGTIPSWLLYNVTLDSLSLRGNFLEGPFPKPTHHNMSTLRGLDISNNGFFGELPPNIDTLFPNLVLFNMSTNELQGAIPLSLSKFQKLNTLDLSQNKLFGEMPEGLIGNNTSLKYLKLSHNGLQGNIHSKYWNTT